MIHVSRSDNTHTIYQHWSKSKDAEAAAVAVW